MLVYLAKFTMNQRYCYKFGYTLKGDALDRFDKAQYEQFNIQILGSIRFSRPDYKVAVNEAKDIEKVLLETYRDKKFDLDQHFNTEPGHFKSLSGKTEMFIVDDERHLLDTFYKLKQSY